MSWRDDINANRTLITAIHIVAWAVMSGVGVVVIILVGLFSLVSMIILLIVTFVITIPISISIAKAMNSPSANKERDDL